MKELDLYLDYCRNQKKLSEKTLEAYTVDLSQFIDFTNADVKDLCRKDFQDYLSHVHHIYKPRSAKRKIASLKAYYSFLTFENIIEENPFHRIKTKFSEPEILPKTISLADIQSIFAAAYTIYASDSNTAYRELTHIRNIAILELMFATGMRVSELCKANDSDIDLENGIIKIRGKGAKERVMQISHSDALESLRRYTVSLSGRTKKTQAFFINRRNERISDQSIRGILSNCVKASGIAVHVTPHMFRHSFATLLLEEDVDIRYIQRMLGHSSITTTQIYTQVSFSKLKNILSTKHPRNKICDCKNGIPG